MAIDKRLKIYDEQGNEVDYDILATDVKFLPDGKDLPTKLDELEQEIGEGGYTPPAGGIPATDLSSDVQTSLGKADSAYQKPASGIPATDIADGVIPDTSNLATKTDLAAKVDKVTGYGLSKNDYTDADKAAVGTIGSKANDNVVVKSISVNGQNPQTPTQGNVNINVQGVAGKSAYQSYLDTTSDNPKMTESQWVAAILRSAYRSYLATTSDNPVMTEAQWLASLKGDQGDTGNCTITDAGQMVSEIVNDLTTGGANKFLSAEMGKRLRTAIVNLLDQLAPMAFVGTKPTADSLGLNGVSYDIDLGGLDVHTTIDNEQTTITEGMPYSATIGAMSGYVLKTVVVTHNGVSVQTTIANNQCVISIPNVEGDIVITTTSAAAVAFGTNLIGCSLNNVAAELGGSYTGKLTASTGNTMTGAIVHVLMGNGDITSTAYDDTTGVITIGEVTGAIEVTAYALDSYGYVAGMVFHLDGFNHGDTDHPNAPESWIDLVGGVDFPNHGATWDSSSGKWSFDGVDDYMGYLSNSADKSLAFSPLTHTIEGVAYSPTVSMNIILLSSSNASTNDSASAHTASIYLGTTAYGYINGVKVSGTNSVWNFSDSEKLFTVSLNKDRGMENGHNLSSKGENHWSGCGGGRLIGVASNYDGGTPEIRWPAQGSIYCVRVYDRILTEEEMRHNQNVDNTRFSLGLTIANS